MTEKVQHKGLALLVLAAAQFMVILDATIVNVALPSIERALHFTSTTELQWIVTAYTLLFGGFLLLGGRMADLFGRRKLFLTGVILFATASLIGGLSQNPGMLIVFRSLQGLGGALLSPAALSLVLSIFKEGHERNRALGVWSGVAAGGGAVGLLLGGILTQYASWRWIFFINVPVAILLAVVAPRFVPESFAHDGNRRVDVLGAVSVTAGLMSLVYALVKAPQYGWGSAHTLVTLAISAALLIGFVVNELVVNQPLMRLSIFKNRNVSIGNLIQLPVGAGMFSVFFYLSIYLQQILHYSPVKAGVVNLPFTFFIALTAGIASRTITKIAPKFFLVLGPLLSAGGLYYFSRIPVDGHYLSNLFPGIALMASGMGMTFVALTLTATSGVSHKESGLASGLLNTSQQIGGALGLAVLTAVSTAHTKSVIASHHLNGVTPFALVQGFKQAFLVAGFFMLGAGVIALIGVKRRNLTPQQVADETEIEAEGMPVVPGI